MDVKVKQVNHEHGVFYRVYANGQPVYGTEDETDAHRFATMLRSETTTVDSLPALHLIKQGQPKD